MGPVRSFCSTSHHPPHPHLRLQPPGTLFEKTHLTLSTGTFHPCRVSVEAPGPRKSLFDDTRPHPGHESTGVVPSPTVAPPLGRPRPVGTSYRPHPDPRRPGVPKRNGSLVPSVPGRGVTTLCTTVSGLRGFGSVGFRRFRVRGGEDSDGGCTGKGDVCR